MPARRLTARPRRADARARAGRGDPPRRARSRAPTRPPPHVYLKVATTPDRFPRRAGMARKRPLQASTAALRRRSAAEPMRAVRPRCAASLRRDGHRSTRSPTRRAAWARRRRPSTSPRASPRPATRRCWSTSTRRPTRPSGSGIAEDAVAGRLRGADAARRRAERRARADRRSRACTLLPAGAGPRGRERRAAAPCRAPSSACASALAPLRERFALHPARLPAVARPADGQRAGRGRPRDRARCRPSTSRSRASPACSTRWR